jgi:hypothetical protein
MKGRLWTTYVLFRQSALQQLQYCFFSSSSHSQSQSQALVREMRVGFTDKCSG